MSFSPTLSSLLSLWTCPWPCTLSFAAPEATGLGRKSWCAPSRPTSQVPSPTAPLCAPWDLAAPVPSKVRHFCVNQMFFYCFLFDVFMALICDHLSPIAPLARLWKWLSTKIPRALYTPSLEALGTSMMIMCPRLWKGLTLPWLHSKYLSLSWSCLWKNQFLCAFFVI